LFKEIFIGRSGLDHQLIGIVDVHYTKSLISVKLATVFKGQLKDFTVC